VLTALATLHTSWCLPVPSSRLFNLLKSTPARYLEHEVGTVAPSPIGVWVCAAMSQEVGAEVGAPTVTQLEVEFNSDGRES